MFSARAKLAVLDTFAAELRAAGLCWHESEQLESEHKWSMLDVLAAKRSADERCACRM